MAKGFYGHRKEHTENALRHGKGSIYEALKQKLGHEPTSIDIANAKISHAEMKAYHVQEMLAELKKPNPDYSVVNYHRLQAKIQSRWHPIRVPRSMLRR